MLKFAHEGSFSISVVGLGNNPLLREPMYPSSDRIEPTHGLVRVGDEICWYHSPSSFWNFQCCRIVYRLATRIILLLTYDAFSVILVNVSCFVLLMVLREAVESFSKPKPSRQPSIMWQLNHIRYCFPLHAELSFLQYCFSFLEKMLAKTTWGFSSLLCHRVNWCWNFDICPQMPSQLGEPPDYSAESHHRKSERLSCCCGRSSFFVPHSPECVSKDTNSTKFQMPRWNVGIYQCFQPTCLPVTKILLKKEIASHLIVCNNSKRTSLKLAT